MLYYITTVGEYVSKVRVTASVPSDIKVCLAFSNFHFQFLAYAPIILQGGYLSFHLQIELEHETSYILILHIYLSSDCTCDDLLQVYELTLNSTKLFSGEESSPIPIGDNGERVDFAITISAPSYSSNTYLLSVYRSKPLNS